MKIVALGMELNCSSISHCLVRKGDRGVTYVCMWLVSVCTTSRYPITTHLQNIIVFFTVPSQCNMKSGKIIIKNSYRIN